MTEPLIALLYRLNQNQNALGAAIEELAIWVEQRGSTEAANKVKQHLQVLVENSDVIADALAELIAKQTT
ncbi:hypothetical protein ACT048_04860 [Ectopseudomonas khazarica]|uniref:hypothetical protein n=1 Tax=Ectopseudomonas khazarica TaxID=2502979 RepID=UPI0040338B61